MMIVRGFFTVARWALIALLLLGLWEIAQGTLVLGDGRCSWPYEAC